MVSVALDISDNSIILAKNVVAKLVMFIKTTLAVQHACHIVFPGGQSPKLVFEILSKEQIEWSKLHFYPSDERCVPQGSLDRNDLLIDNCLIQPGLLPEANLHRMPAELGAVVGANLYNDFLNSIPPFDLVLLGVGSDGHTASLFPGLCYEKSIDNALPIFNSPKLPPERITLTVNRLRFAKERWCIMTGSEKQQILSRVLQQENLPVTKITPTMLFVDCAAMGH